MKLHTKKIFIARQPFYAKSNFGKPMEMPRRFKKLKKEKEQTS